MLFIFSELRLSNGWVATAPYQLSFKNVVLISLCVLVLISEGFSVCRVDMADTIKMVGSPIFSSAVKAVYFFCAHQ